MSLEYPTDPRQALEVSLTALILGELPADQAQFLREALVRDPELASIHHRLLRTIELVRQTESKPSPSPSVAPEPLRISDEKRQRLLEHFKSIPLPQIEQPRRRGVSPWILAAAAVVVCLMAASMLLPALGRAKSKGQYASWAIPSRQVESIPLSEPVEDFSLTVRNGAAPQVGMVADPQQRLARAEIVLPQAGEQVQEKLSSRRELAREELVALKSQDSVDGLLTSAGALPATPPPAAVADVTAGAAVSRVPRQDLSDTAAGAGFGGGGAGPQPQVSLRNRSGLDRGVAVKTESGRSAESSGNLGIPLSTAVPPTQPPAATPYAITPTPPSAFYRRGGLAQTEESISVMPPSVRKFALPISEAETPVAGAINPQTGLPMAQAVAPRPEQGQDLYYANPAELASGASTTLGDTPVLGRAFSTAQAQGGRQKGVDRVVGDLAQNEVAGKSLNFGTEATVRGFYDESEKSQPSLGYAVNGPATARGQATAPKQPARVTERFADWDYAKALDSKNLVQPEFITNGAEQAGRQLDQLNRSAGAFHWYDSQANAAFGQQSSEGNQVNAEPEVLRERSLGLEESKDKAAEGQTDLEGRKKVVLTGITTTTGGPAMVKLESRARTAPAGGVQVTNGVVAQSLEKDQRLARRPAISAGKESRPPVLVESFLREAGSPKQPDPAPAKPAMPPPVPQPEVSTAESAFSTFSLNVSDVSFKLAAASLEKGVLPDAAGIRSEEFINAFDYRDPEPAAGMPVAFAWERARYPFAQNRDLLRFSVKTAAQGRQAGRPLNLVLLVDNSGSMERADRERILREALRVLVTQLQPQDKLSVITFSRVPHLWFDGVAGNQEGNVAEQIPGLTPEGGTNLEEALGLAYKTAARHYISTGINRVVLLTDGAANLGDVEPERLKVKVEENRKQGIALDCFGIGWEGYNDDLLEVLSRNGDGRYGFINTPEEASTEFAAQLAGALRVAASDVKVQVEFNPSRVSAYRQIGYAKHQLTKEQFRDNTVDAAEIGAAEAGNALYAVEVNPQGQGPLAMVRVRYKVPGTADYYEHDWTVTYQGNAPALEQASPAMRLAASASAFSEWLASNPYAAGVTTDSLLALMRGVPQTYGVDPRPQKLEWMIRQAKAVSGR